MTNTFPNIYIGIGSNNDFIKDIQHALGLEPSGEFDFLTMCYVTVHKHQNGLNAQDPVVDQGTWDSLFKVDSDPYTLSNTDLVESVSSPDSNAVTPKTDENAPTTFTGVTTATPENNPAADEVKPPEAPKEPDTTPGLEPAPDTTPGLEPGPDTTPGVEPNNGPDTTPGLEPGPDKTPGLEPVADTQGEPDPTANPETAPETAPEPPNPNPGVENV